MRSGIPASQSSSAERCEFGRTKPQFQTEKPGRAEFLGRWPDALAAAKADAESQGGMMTARRQDALHFIHGDAHPVLESLLVSTKELTAGVVDLMPGARSVKIVTMKLRAPRIDDRPMSWIARIQKVWPSPGENFAVVSGTYDVQPPAGRSP